MTSIVLILALVVGPPLAQKKRDWMEGRVIEVNFREDLQVSTASGRDGGGLTGTSKIAYFTYTVESNGTRYTLQEQATKPRYSEGAMIKFAVEKKNWFFLDEKGKEKKGELKGTKKVAPF